MASLPPELIDRVLTRHPLPVADALSALLSAAGPHERRDRVVECMRAVVRLLAAVAMAVRAQHGPAADTGAELGELLSQLRRRGLTDGQWVALLRELLRPTATRPAAHPVPPLVGLLHGGGSAARALEGLLAMRKTETVAHGATGDPEELEEILARRVPQLAELLAKSDAVWDAFRIAVPLGPAAAGDGARPAWLLMGCTPPRGRWRRIELATGAGGAAGEVCLVDAADRPRVRLHPLVLFRSPTPDAVEELFLLDGGRRGSALYVAYPSMAEHQEAEVWSLLRGLLDEEDVPPEDLPGDVVRPYRGLTSFGVEHARLFFGREEEAEALANRVRATPVVTVTGPSGAGKSSLLVAGALPRIAEREAIVVRPGPDPVRALRHALGELWDDDAPEAVAERCHAAGRRLLLVVDQAEELFALCDDAAVRDAAAERLASAAVHPSGAVHVVLVVRQDFFGELAALPRLGRMASRAVEVVGAPGRDALERALVRPAALFGYAFEDDMLVREIVDAVAGRDVALPLLSFCADRLWDARDRAWKRLTWDGYRALGGVEGAIAAHAEATLDRLTPSQRNAARLLLLRLVTPHGTRASIGRTALLESLAEHADGPAVLDRLLEARLVVAREDAAGGGALVELAHEALLRTWSRLREWQAEDGAFLRARARVSAAAADWAARQRHADFLLSEGQPIAEAEPLLERAGELDQIELAFIRASLARARRRRARARIAMVVLAALALAASTLALSAWRLSEQSEASAAEARAKEREAIASGNEAALAHARGLFRSDPTSAVAWLLRLSPRGSGFRGARMIATEAAARGVARHVLRFPEAITRARSVETGMVAVADPDRLHLVDLAAGEVRDLRRGSIRELDFSADGSVLAGADDRGVIRVWTLPSADERRLSPTVARIDSLQLSANGRRLLVRTAGDEPRGAGQLWTWDLEAGGERGLRIRGVAAGRFAALSRDGATLGVLTPEQHVVLIDLGTDRRSDLGLRANVLYYSVSPDGRLLELPAPSGFDLFEVRTGRARIGDAAGEPVQCIELSADGGLAATVGETLRVRDTTTWSIVHEAARPAGELRCRPFAPDGHAVVFGTVGERTTTVRRTPGGETSTTSAPDDGGFTWHLDDGGSLEAWAEPERPWWTRPAAGPYHLEAIPEGTILHAGDDRRFELLHDGPLHARATSDDGSVLIAEIGDGDELFLFDVPRGGRRLISTVSGQVFFPAGSRDPVVESGSAFHVFPGETAAIGWGGGDRTYGMELSPDGSHAVVLSFPGELVLFDVATGEVRVRLPAPANGSRPGALFAWQAVFESDGAAIRAWAGPILRRIDVDSGRVETLLELAEGSTAEAVAPAGRVIAVRRPDHTIALRSFGAGGGTTSLGDVSRAWLSDDGQLAFTLRDGVVTVWEAASGRRRERRRCLPEPFGGEWVQASGDGTVVLCAEARRGRGAARLWDRERDRLVDLPAPAFMELQTVVARDGEHVAVASVDGVYVVGDGHRARLARIPGTAAGLELLPDGLLLIWAGTEVLLWDWQEGEVATLVDGDDIVAAARASEDGRLVLVAHPNGTIERFDVAPADPDGLRRFIEERTTARAAGAGEPATPRSP